MLDTHERFYGNARLEYDIDAIGHTIYNGVLSIAHFPGRLSRGYYFTVIATREPPYYYQTTGTPPG